ncbi:MAG: glycosyltransferase [Bacteroidetes bacterium]|nr:MAG: glycosyltransferase [Bacteroidota bacterium]TAG87646.1 MAG: glycosyltransferase [Bacteroidota bacterium]
MTISVIIPTYNGAYKLPNILDALAKQTYQNFETIVMVDGSTDNTIEILENKKNWNLKNFKFVVQQNGGRAKVRNAASKHATGELLIFFDDDTRPTPTYIQNVVKFYAQNLEAILIGNHALSLDKCQNDFDKFRVHNADNWVKDFKPSPFLMKTPVMTAANCSIPTHIFQKLEGFDNHLTDAEDFDMAMRAFELNIPIYFDFDNIAWHDDFVSCKKYIQRLRQYKQSHIDLERLKPTLLAKYPVYTTAKLNFLKRIVYGFFGNFFWVKVIDKFNFLQFLPNVLKYKIYDYVITGLGQYYKNRSL